MQAEGHEGMGIDHQREVLHSEEVPQSLEQPVLKLGLLHRCWLVLQYKLIAILVVRPLPQMQICIFSGVCTFLPSSCLQAAGS